MRRPGKPDPLAEACHTLLPLLRAAQQLLLRKRIAVTSLVDAVPGLEAWARAHGVDPVEIAERIMAPGANPKATTFAIVKRATRTRRTEAQLAKYYEKWLCSRPRAST